MWTPRRVLLLVLGIISCCTAYASYASVLGWIDGLPPLPEDYLRPADTSEPPLVRTVNLRDQHIREAFGPNCEELNYTIKLEVRAKGLVLAAGEFVIEPDGRVQLAPFSLATFGKSRPLDARGTALLGGAPALVLFGKGKGRDGAPEINTVHCDQAYVEFDRPVRNPAEMGSRTIVSVLLVGNPDFPTRDPRKGRVHITNNRGTLDFEDDIVLRTPGPVEYRENPKPLVPGGPRPPHIWTTSPVELTDRQNSPRPAGDNPVWIPTVTAEGMKVYLATEPEAPPQAEGTPRKPDQKAPGSVIGLDRVDLNSTVLMNLWVDGSNNPFGGGESPPAAPRPKDKDPTPAEKVLVQVRTNGPFQYDALNDRAHFEIAPRSAPGIPNQVIVVRHAKPNALEMLACDYLDLQFRRDRPPAKGEGPPPRPAGERNGPPLEISRVHAWGKTVAISSDPEQLQAWGNDLVYDRDPPGGDGKAEKLPTTVLKGDRMIAVKDGNLIEAKELILTGKDSRDTQARVRGPGRLGLGDIDPVTKKHSRQAHWEDWLLFSKDVALDADKRPKLELDVITLTGGARFTDTASEQFLQGRQLKLWLIAGEPGKPAPKAGKPEPKPEAKKAASPDQRRPHRLEAVGQVVAHSPELNVKKADYLNVWFKDVPPPARPQPPQPAPKTPGPAAPPAPKADAAPANPMPPPPPAAAKEPPKPEKGKPPIELEARRVETWVNRTGARNDLDKVHCVGGVVVHQDPAADQERGVDIAGHELDLKHFADGDVLTVVGKEADAEVHFEKLSLVGREVFIDQRDNLARVKGAGSMRMLSSTNLQGEKLETASPLTVHWKNGMEFQGSGWATFEGNVSAEQDGGRILCQVMQVQLDREVRLNQLQRTGDSPNGKEAPKVKTVVCDQQPPEGFPRPAVLQPVSMEDVQRTGRQLQRYQKIESCELSVDNLQGVITAPGPGVVRILQPGAKEPLEDPADPNKKKKDGPPEEEMKLTWVEYKRRMSADSKNRTAQFYEDVQVVHVPTENPHLVIDVNKLPPGAIHLKCQETLKVYTHKSPPNAQGRVTTWQELRAKGNAFVRSDEFDGFAEEIKFDESKNLITFQGSRDNKAKLRRFKPNAAQPEEFRGEKIIYNRKTREFKVDGGVGVQAQ